MRRHHPVAVALLLSAALAVTACTGERQTVDGAFGEPHALTFLSSGPPAELATQLLVEGDGRVVTGKDVVVADYLGQVRGSVVSDGSFDSGAPIVNALSGLVRGWAKGLVGHKVGSRVLLSRPRPTRTARAATRSRARTRGSTGPGRASGAPGRRAPPKVFPVASTNPSPQASSACRSAAACCCRCRRRRAQRSPS